MDISVRGIKSLINRDQSITINGLTLITGANSSGKSSFLLGLKFLDRFLSKQQSLEGKNLIHKVIDIRELDPAYNSKIFSNNCNVDIEIVYNKDVNFKIVLKFSPVDEYRYSLNHLELLLNNSVLSIRSNIIYEDDTQIYFYLTPLWNWLSILSTNKEFLDQLKKTPFHNLQIDKEKPKANIFGVINYLKKHENNNTSKVYIDAICECFLSAIKTESFLDNTAKTFQNYLHLIQNLDESMIGVIDFYSKSDIATPNNDNSDSKILIASIESTIDQFVKVADGKVTEFIKSFEKISQSEFVMALGEKKITIVEHKLSQDSPLTIASLFLSDFSDSIIESCLQQISFSAYDKSTITPKSYFTANDGILFENLTHITDYYRNKDITKHFLKKQFSKLTAVGKELITTTHLDGKVKTIQVKLAPNQIIDIYNLGTGHFYITVLYLKLLSFLETFPNTKEDDGLKYESMEANSEKVLVLIEPESFLHPSAQVQLAELLIYFVNKGLKMIIETHSEHLLRAIQLKIAQNSISSTKIKIFYFENNKGTSIRNIRIDKRGFLLDKFGSGFLDETPRLIQDFFKVNKN